MTPITTDDLLDAIRQALGPQDAEDALTVQEFTEKTGWGRTKITATLGRLHKDGRIEVVRVRRPSLDGRQFSIPAYRLKP